MSFQGHIENGVVVFDEPVSLPAGTVVRIEPVASPLENSDSSQRPLADTDQAYTVQEMSGAWKAITRPIPGDDVSISFDPDDYPLY